MSDLSKKFSRIAADIAERRSPTLHYPLLPLMAEANGGIRAFNRAALRSHGIDPDEFLTAWAIGFAKGTLSMNSPNEFFDSVVRARCETCLTTETSDSFGNYMPEDLKERLIAKQESLAPP